MPEILPFLALLLASTLSFSEGQRAAYRFATLQFNFESLVTYLRFRHIEPGNVYVATTFLTGCSRGKFGGRGRGLCAQLLRVLFGRPIFLTSKSFLLTRRCAFRLCANALFRSAFRRFENTSWMRLFAASRRRTSFRMVLLYLSSDRRRTIAGQVHADGSQALVLGVWDYDGIHGSARAESPWCTRFSQGRGHVWPAGTGVRCIVDTQFQVGFQYRFSLSKDKNSSGTLWSLDVNNGNSTSRVGSVFVSQIGADRDCSLLEPLAESSMEYYTGGDFLTEASWWGPFLGGDGGVEPVEVDVDCGSEAGAEFIPAAVAANGRPNVLFSRGRAMPHACERRSLWALFVGSPRHWRPSRELLIGLAAILLFFLVALAGAWVWISQQEEQQLQQLRAAEDDAKQAKPLLSALSFSSKASSLRSNLLSAPSFASSRASSHHTVLQQEWLESQRRLNAMSAASSGLELEEPGPKPPQQEVHGVESEIHTP